MASQILVATDGTPAAMGALRLARALVEQHGGSVEVVTVVEPFPATRSPLGELVGMTPRELEHAAVESARAQVRDQLTELGPMVAAWPVAVEAGSPAPTIVQVAHRCEASLILLGLGRHELADRLFGSETALRVMRLAHVPVLAVPAEARALPRTAVVAVDFSEFSRDAAQTAVDCLASSAEVHLVHVIPVPASDAVWSAGTEWVESYHSGVALRLEEMARVLEGPADVRVHTRLLEGDPAAEVLRLAEDVGAELIAAGSHGASFFGRVLMGSVSTRLIRGATCAVLIAPPRSMPAELDQAWRDSRSTAYQAGEPLAGTRS